MNKDTMTSAWRNALRACCVMTLLTLALACGAARAAPLDITHCPVRNVQCVDDLKTIHMMQLEVDINDIYVADCRRLEEESVAASAHRMSSLWYQYFASWIILFLGIAVIFSGLAMSWVQMSKGLRDNVSFDNAVEVGPGIFKIRSPVVGLIVFAASIYFFTIYIDKVYRITDVLRPDTTTAAAADPLASKRCASIMQPVPVPSEDPSKPRD